MTTGGILGDPHDWHRIAKTTKPDTRTPEERRADDEHLHNIILLGAQYEQDKLAEADEKALSEALCAAFETEYAEYIILKDTPLPATLKAYTTCFKEFIQFCRGIRVKPCPAQPGVVAAFLDER